MKFTKHTHDVLVFLVCACLILGAVFVRDIEKSVGALRGVPSTGAEDASLYALRAGNRRAFDSTLTLAIADPMAAHLYFRAFHANALDNIIFAADEAADKSPFSWPKALLAPGALACQYASHFFDTDPLLVGGMCGAFIADDLIMWASVAALLGVAGFAALNKAHFAHHTERATSFFGEIASAEAKALFAFVSLKVYSMGVSVIGTYVIWALTFLVPNFILDYLFGFYILVNVALTIDVFAHLLGLTVVSDILDVVTGFPLRALISTLPVVSAAGLGLIETDVAAAAAFVATGVSGHVAADEHAADFARAVVGLKAAGVKDDDIRGMLAGIRVGAATAAAEAARLHLE